MKSIQNKQLLFPDSSAPESPVIKISKIIPKQVRKKAKKPKTKVKRKTQSRKKARKQEEKHQLWQQKESLIQKYITEKKYGHGIQFMSFNDMHLQSLRLDTDDEINHRHESYAHIDSNFGHRKLSLDNVAPSFDNNVLGNDPFGRLGKIRNELFYPSTSPQREANNTISHPEQIYQNDLLKSNNFSRFKKNSNLLNINATKGGYQINSYDSLNLDPVYNNLMNNKLSQDLLKNQTMASTGNNFGQSLNRNIPLQKLSHTVTQDLNSISNERYTLIDKGC